MIIGVRHHSPVCARIVADTIARLEPSHVLIEGPADFNDRLDELRLEHELPIALFSHVRRGSRSRVSWTPFTEWSPEWVALHSAWKIGAETTFIDLPTWHHEFVDPSPTFGPALSRTLSRLALDTEDALWDHVVESRADLLNTDALTAVLDDYFDTVRGGDQSVSERERYMASWIRATDSRPSRGAVVVVCGGVHRPAIIAELSRSPVPVANDPPSVPPPERECDVGSYLVPYSYDRMPDVYPWWYEATWADPNAAADRAIDAIVGDLRSRGHRPSTVDFIALREQMFGLASLRGHAVPTRTDVLDAAAATLIDEALTARLPWTLPRNAARKDLHPVVASCLDTMRGNRRGVLHPDSPVPGLVHHIEDLLDRESLGPGTVVLDLADPVERNRSRILHRLRLLRVPGFDRDSGPDSGVDPVSTEIWTIDDSPDRIPSLIEAAAQGHTLIDAAGVALDVALESAGSEIPLIARILFDSILCGLDSQSERTGGLAVAAIQVSTDLGGVGVLLRTSLDMWRHDSLFGGRGSAILSSVVDSASARITTLSARERASAAGADLPRIAALAAISDVMRHAPQLLTDDPTRALTELAHDRGGAVDIRGAALGAVWNTTTTSTAVAAARSIRMENLGDWLAGLLGVAREKFSDAGSGDHVLHVVDDVVSNSSEHDFLAALPALRQAFEFFPPRERARIARSLAVTDGPDADVKLPLRDTVEAGRQLDARVDTTMARIGLL